MKGLTTRTRNVLGIEGDRRRRAVLRGAEGAQLLEFAIVLPLLLVLLLGVIDFSSIYNLKQKLNNATREGARFASTLNCADCAQSTSPSTQAVRDVVANYLSNANVTVCTIGSTQASAGALAWQYSSPTAGNGCPNFTLLIERGYIVNSGGLAVVSTRVTLTYPIKWSFDSVIGLLVPGAQPVLPTTVKSDSIMQNLT